MKDAYKEVQLCLQNNQHNLSTETLQLCLEALRIVTEQEHNGWKNYPTWLVAAYIDNTEPEYNFYSNIREGLKKSEEDDQAAIGILAQTMMFDFSTDMEKIMNDHADTIWYSILNAQQKEIDYMEIAKQFYEEE